MRSTRPLLAISLLLSSAACTALLGDFSVAPGDLPDDDGGLDGPTEADVGSGADAEPGDGALDARPDAPVDAGPPKPDGGFLSLYTFGSTTQSPPGNMRVAYDLAGNLFVLFAYSIPDLDVLGVKLPIVGSFDMGLLKIGPDGKRLWVRSYGSTAQEYPGGLAVDAKGDVYVSGASESASIDFGGTAGTLTRKSNRYLGWIAKFSGANGDPIHAIGVDSPGNHQGALCQSLAVRGNRVAAMCNVYGPAIFPVLPGGAPGTFTPPDGATSTVGFVVAELDLQLRAHWVDALGSDAQDFGGQVTLAPNDDLLLVANTNASAATTFSDSKGTVSLQYPAGQTTLVARFAGASGAAVWARPFSFATGGPYAQLNGLVADPGGRIITVGAVSGAVDLGGKMIASAGQTDVLVAAFEPVNGGVVDAKVYGVGSRTRAAPWGSIAGEPCPSRARTARRG